jgi:hypothetical protein
MMRNTMLVATTALCLAGCSVGQDKSVAEQAVTEFHNLLDGARYHDVWETTSPDFRRENSEAALTGLISQVHDRLGDFQDARETGWRVSLAPGGRQVTLNYVSRYARGSANEDFIYQLRPEGPRLLSYSVHGEPTSAAPPATPPAAGKPGADPGPATGGK